ncbi:sugar ABC transporter permease [uncultured Abiotrophia sp.]|uniref:carbohydrate ABC transporter permease n=1 Tax=uncultured Abiotrophia sp. TaxID=316094 RepID=UPI0028D201B1|nr:sugar ABC transporter permease [uncultured Abiotrophia sp.]
MNILKKQLNFRNVSVLFLIVYFAVFLFYPIYKAFAGSLHDWNPLTQKYNYIGWENYSFVLGDKLFWKSLTNTLFFTFVSTVLRLAVGLALALMLFSRMTKMRTFFQGLFYMPTVTPMVAVSFVWMWMFNPQFGLINRFFHLDINWLKNSNWAMIAIIIMTVWKDFGYATVLFLAGLMGLPEEVYEASRIDGANGWQTFKNITLPLLKPVTLFVTITSLISYFQTYIQILIMTEGGPGTSTFVISYLIFDEAFVNYNFGTASAIAVILFVVIAVLTLLMFRYMDMGGDQQ